jgi:putative membrane protein
MNKRNLWIWIGLMLALALATAAFAQSSQSGSAQGASGAQGTQGTQSPQSDQSQAGAAAAPAPATGAQAGAGAQEPAAAQGAPSEQGQPAAAQGTPASEPAPAGGAQQGTGAEGSQGPSTAPTTPSSRAPALGPGGPGAQGAGAPSSELAATDKSFIRDAALADLEAEELGRLAAAKASSPEVKAFGQKLADDHKQAYDSLKQAASSVHQEPPSRPSSHAKSDVARLEKLSGADFDREFLSLVVKQHQKDLSVFERESKRATAPAGLKSLASSTLQGLQDHLKMAQDLSGKLGTASPASPGSASSPQHP